MLALLVLPDSFGRKFGKSPEVETLWISRILFKLEILTVTVGVAHYDFKLETLTKASH